MNRDDTLVLFGRSPFIKTIADFIPAICTKWHTLGCNFFVDTFPIVESVIFYDDICPAILPQHLVITNKKHERTCSKKCHSMCMAHENIEYYEISRHQKIPGVIPYGFSDKADTLNFFFHTPSIAIEWAYKKGFKNVVLAGIDLIRNTEHFDKDTAPDKAIPAWDQADIDLARAALEKINEKYLRVWQLNPVCSIDIPKISIDALIS